jgi:CrcB protein
MQRFLIVGIGGFVGACLRYLVSLISLKLWGVGFPYGTLIVNMAGGILIGLIMELGLTTDLVSPALRLLLVTGMLGAFTTFSTFSYETINLFNNGSFLLGSLNIFLNLCLSLGGVVLGKYILLLL